MVIAKFPVLKSMCNHTFWRIAQNQREYKWKFVKVKSIDDQCGHVITIYHLSYSVNCAFIEHRYCGCLIDAPLYIMSHHQGV